MTSTAANGAAAANATVPLSAQRLGAERRQPGGASTWRSEVAEHEREHAHAGRRQAGRASGTSSATSVQRTRGRARGPTPPSRARSSRSCRGAPRRRTARTAWPPRARAAPRFRTGDARRGARTRARSRRRDPAARTTGTRCARSRSRPARRRTARIATGRHQHGDRPAAIPEEQRGQGGRPQRVGARRGRRRSGCPARTSARAGRAGRRG